MSKVILFGKNKEKIKDLVLSKGFEIVESNANFVVSFGGDGTLMNSEDAYPGIPKIVLRESEICKKCSNLSNEQVLDSVKNKKYKIEELIKVEATAKGKTLIGLNDVIVHNHDARRGIRYKVLVNDNDLGKEIIGDGIVMATPFGSTAYYRSITDGSSKLVSASHSTTAPSRQIIWCSKIIQSLGF